MSVAAGTPSAIREQAAELLPHSSELTTALNDHLFELMPELRERDDGTLREETWASCEANVLQILRLLMSGAGPEAIDFFQEWEHLFLVQEHIDFGPLTTFLAAKSPLAHGDVAPEGLATYRREAETVLANLRTAIAACHERGICYGDVSLTNVMVEAETLAVRLVDFESSRPFDEWHGDTPATTTGNRADPASGSGCTWNAAMSSCPSLTSSPSRSEHSAAVRAPVCLRRESRSAGGPGCSTVP